MKLRLPFRITPELLGLALMLLVFGAAVYVIHEMAHEIDLKQLWVSLKATAPINIAYALLATMASYTAMFGYDLCGTRYAGIKLPISKIFPISFCAFGLGNTIGFGSLASGAVRYRLYTAFGVTPEEIGKIVAFIMFGFGMGIGAVGGLGLLFEANSAAPLLHVSARLLIVAALIFLGLFVSLLLWAGSGAEVKVGKMTFRLPTPALLSLQLPISILDLVTAAGTLWFLLPNSNLSFMTFASFYALAIALGIISHVPGGLGVFESAMLFLLKDKIPTADLAAALVGYRFIYYFVPFLMAVVWLGWQEARSLQKLVRHNAILASWRRVAPDVLGILIFLTGAVLLISGVVPAGHRQLSTLGDWLPLPLQEGAHFLSSLGGLGLIILAQGLRWRSNLAWAAVTIIIALNIPLALAKGLAVTEASLYAVALLLLLSSRRAFYRPAGLLSVPFDLSWWLTVLATLGGMVWLLFFAYQHVEYSSDLWWQFENLQEAPRSLRAALGVAIAFSGFGLMLLLRPTPRTLAQPDVASLERAAAIVRQQRTTDAGLALTGDKYLLFSDSGNSFIMYGAQRRSWIALYDPIGPFEEAQELIWKFREAADRAGARPAFYEASADYLPLYIDAGFTVLRLGEQAFVKLANFDLNQPALRSVRQTFNRAERDGLSLDFIDAAEVPAQIGMLRGISDAWLAQHRAREKGFSLGRFDPAYVRRNTVAVVRYKGEAVAFATMLLTDKLDEVSIDLMRHAPSAPRNTMDFLFISLIREFQQRGYGYFNLGMAPLAGLTNNPLAPLWHRLGRRFYLYGERFYNFQGLRAYKDKYNPLWQPRYLATLSGSNPYLVLADITKLVAGGWKGAIGK